MTLGLAARLRNATKDLHASAERSTFMARLIRGQLDARCYYKLLKSLQAIYAALEAELTRNAHRPTVAAIYLVGLARTEALSLDLRALEQKGSFPADDLPEAASEYVLRLLEVGANQPELLVAHAYVRYLGDLSGGQILRRIVAKSLGVETAFYDFGTTEQVNALVATFRQALDRLLLNEDQSEDVVAEANLAFSMHVRLFDELASTSAEPLDLPPGSRP